MKDNTKTLIVAIGASAGGLEAIQDFFKNTPLKTGLAFVVIQHLSPDYKSMMDELLARHTKIDIKKVEDGMLVEPDTIYLIPPRKNMSVYHGKLYLEDQDSKKGLNLPIDIFFRSLAAEAETKAIGVILSGTGSDGTLGIKAIKENGGMVMVQDKNTAKFDGMPASSIATGLVDYVLPPTQMVEELLNYIRHPFVDKENSLKKQLSESIDTLSKILLVLRDYIGVDFSYYKENTIVRRLERRLSINRFNNLDQYLKFLIDSNKEKETLYRELLIGVTRFFRDTEAFDSLIKNVIPKIASKKSPEQIRIWSAGCSTGEEVYSLAMLISEHLEKNNLQNEVKIFATDLDRKAIEFAGNGIYPENIIADVPPEFVTKYFNHRDGYYQITEKLRKMVVFATHNVLKDPPFSKMSLISCRNLFIYFKPEIQTKVLSTFYFSLQNDAYLFMGSSETIGEMSEAFTVIDTKSKIYKKKKGYKNEIIGTLSIPGVTRIKDNINIAFNHQVLNLKSDFITDKIYNIFVPPSIIIDQHNNLISSVNNINRFLKIPAGKFTNDVFQLLLDEFRPVVRSIIRSLKTKKDYVKFENIKNVQGFEKELINVEGRQFLEPKDEKQYYFISFIIIEDQLNLSQNAEIIDFQGDFSEKVKDLEKELQYTKENLQATVEELETSNEELQSSNEELIASNEELQSTNEELQSVNEELYTVNSEYQNKIDELILLNNDINNLLKNINVGTLYLDSKLCIRKFTSFVTRLIKLRDSDTGRPITHLNLDYFNKDFALKIEEVLETLIPTEMEVLGTDKFWYYVKIMPYRNEDNAVDGIIVTFTDISNLKVAVLKQEEASTRLIQAMNIGKIAWWELDLISNKVIFDDKKATMIGYKPSEFPTDVYDVCKLIHPDDYEFVMNEMKEYLSGNREAYDVKYRIKRKDGLYSWYYDRGGAVEYDESGKIIKLTGMVLDISEIAVMSEQIRKDAEIMKIILENSPLAKTLVDYQGKIAFVNPAAAKVLGISEEIIKTRDYDSLDWKITSEKNETILPENLPFGLIKRTKKPVKDFKHYIETNKEKRLINISGSPLFDKSGNVNGALFILELVKLITF